MELRMTDFKIYAILLLACSCWVRVDADCTGQNYECSLLAENANDAAQSFGDLLGSLYDEDAVEKGKSILNKKILGKLGCGEDVYFCSITM